MKDSILMAIESLCDDIATDESAEDNRKRAEAIMVLTMSGRILPEDEEEHEPEGAGDEATEESKLPKPGEIFSYNGHFFVFLGVEQGGLLAIAAEPIAGKKTFDEDNSNDWRSSSLRKYLNGEYIDELGKDYLLPFTSDLTSDDGMKDYGTSEDYVFLLSDDLYRKYRAVIPRYKASWWTITPYSCLPPYAVFERCVNTDGCMNDRSAFFAYAVAPACLVNPKFFE